MDLTKVPTSELVEKLDAVKAELKARKSQAGFDNVARHLAWIEKGKDLSSTQAAIERELFARTQSQAHVETVIAALTETEKKPVEVRSVCTNKLDVAPKAKRKRPPSRTQQWADAVSEGKAALDALRTAIDTLSGLKDEYESQRDNVPENLQAGAYFEKLEAVCDLELPDVDEIEGQLDEAEALDLPLGFGRD